MKKFEHIAADIIKDIMETVEDHHNLSLSERQEYEDNWRKIILNILEEEFHD